MLLTEALTGMNVHALQYQVLQAAFEQLLPYLFKFGSQGQQDDVIGYTVVTKPAKLAAYAAERTIILES